MTMIWENVWTMIGTAFGYFLLTLVIPFFLLPVHRKLISELRCPDSGISSFCQFYFTAGHADYSAVILYGLEGT